MGTFDPTYTSTPDGLDWCRCLTVPRLLTRSKRDGLILQTPVPELDSLRREQTSLHPHAPAKISGRFADIVLEGIRGNGTLTLDNSFQLYFESGRLGVRYLKERHAAGRQERSVPVDALTSVRMLVDGSAVEVFANGGAEVFSCRWFCDESPHLAVAYDFSARRAVAWRMEDVMSNVYATAEAPDLLWPGSRRSNS